MADQKGTTGHPDKTSSHGWAKYYNSHSGVAAGLSMSAPAGPTLSSAELPPIRSATAMSDSWSPNTEPEYGSPSSSMEMPAGAMSPLSLAASPYSEPFPVLPSGQSSGFEFPQLPHEVDDFADEFHLPWKRDSEADPEHDEEHKHIQQSLVQLQRRLDEEQKKVNVMLNSSTAEIADLEKAQSAVASLQKQMLQERAKLANHRPQILRHLQPQPGVPQWLPLTEPPSGNEPGVRAKDRKVPEPDEESSTSSDNGSEICLTPEFSSEDSGSSPGDNGTGNVPDASVKNHHASESDKFRSTSSKGGDSPKISTSPKASSTGPKKVSWADDSLSESEAADFPKISTSPKSSSEEPNKSSWADNSPPVSEASDSDGWAVGLDIDKEAPTSAPVPKAEPDIEKEATISAPIPKGVLSWAQVARRGMQNHPSQSIVRPAKPDRPPSPSEPGNSSDGREHDTWPSGDEPSGGQSSSEPEPDKTDSKNEEKKTAEEESPYAQNLSRGRSPPGDQSEKKDREKEGEDKGKQEGEEENNWKEADADWAGQDWPEQDQGTW
jgi:hypothetical protein